MFSGSWASMLGLELLLARQLLGRRHLRHGVLMVEARLRVVEGAAHDEHRPAMLDGRDAPGGEAAAVAHALDVVDDRPRRIAGQQEVGVQRVGDALRRHRAHGRHQRLAQHLAAVDPLPALLRAAAAKQVLLQRLQVQDGEQTARARCRASGVRVWRTWWAWRHLRRAGRQGKPDPGYGRGVTLRADPYDQTLARDMSSSVARYDVVIAGGGTAGLALACALADALGAGARIAVVDRAPLRRRRGGRDARAFALSAGSKRLLSALGRVAGDRRARPARHRHRHHRLEPGGCLPPGAGVLRQHRGWRRARHLHRRARRVARRPAGGGRRPRRPSPCSAASRPRASRPTSMRSHVDLAQGRRPPLRAALLVAADGRRLAAARGGRHRRRALELSADRHRHDRPARAAAPGPRRAALSARPVRSPSCR